MIFWPAGLPTKLTDKNAPADSGLLKIKIVAIFPLGLLPL